MERKELVFRVRLSRFERETLERLATEAGLSMSSAARIIFREAFRGRGLLGKDQAVRNDSHNECDPGAAR